MSLTWLLATVLGAAIMMWNQAFLRLWVGEDYYAGFIPTLMIIMVVTQFVFIRNDANIIDLTLRLNRKVIMGIVSAGLSICAAGVLVGYFDMGIVGLCLGFIAGRSILSVIYPWQVGRFLGVSLSSQLKSVVRPGIVTGLLFLLSTRLSILTTVNSWLLISNWLGLAIAGGATIVIATILAFFAGLSSHQRKAIFQRAKVVINIQS